MSNQILLTPCLDLRGMAYSNFAENTFSSQCPSGTRSKAVRRKLRGGGGMRAPNVKKM